MNVAGLKSALYIYVVPNILSYDQKISITAAKQVIKNDALKWAKENKIEYTDNNKFLLKVDEGNPNQLENIEITCLNIH